MKLLVAISLLLSAQFAFADEVMHQFQQQKPQQQGQQDMAPNPQKWLGACLLNATDAKLVAYFQFGYNPKEEKWRKMTLADGGGLMVAQSYLVEIGAPKVWLKYVGADEASSWVRSIDGKILEKAPKTCGETQRVAFIESDAGVTLKLLE